LARGRRTFTDEPCGPRIIGELPRGHGPRSKARRRASLQVDGTFDIETEAWSTFVAGALYVPGDIEKIQVFTWREEEAFVDRLLSRKWEIWGHNAGRFDSLWLLKHVLKRKLPAKVVMSGASVIALDVDGAIFRDSARLYPTTLGRLAELGTLKKSSTDLPCSCGTKQTCGGYCSIARNMSDALFSRLKTYLINDVECLYSALDALCTFADRHDIDLCPTVGSSAWATAKRLYGIEAADWSGGSIGKTALYAKARNAYYGGRTQVIRPESPRGFHYDINSAYPAALSQLALPTGERRELHGDDASRAYASGQLGLFRASVRVPECVLPPLPIRTRLRTAYPVGAFSGWWTGVELQSAMSRGATVLRVDEAIAWSDGEMVLKPFCDFVWGLRYEAGKRTALGGWLKFLANSLTGKCAMRPEREEIVSLPEGSFCPADFPCFGVCPSFGGPAPPRCCMHACTGACGALQPIGSVELGLYSSEKIVFTSCMHVEWAGYLTAATRAKLFSFAGDGNDAVYMDTDSLFCEEERHDGLGDKLGDWGVEDKYANFFAHAPKTYRYASSDGTSKAAAKGVPRALENFDALTTGVALEAGVNTLKSAVRSGDLFSRRQLSRKIHADGVHYGDRVLGTDGMTRARHVEQIGEDEWELRV
jgi:hypothetical protein